MSLNLENSPDTAITFICFRSKCTTPEYDLSFLIHSISLAKEYSFQALRNSRNIYIGEDNFLQSTGLLGIIDEKHLNYSIFTVRTNCNWTRRNAFCLKMHIQNLHVEETIWYKITRQVNSILKMSGCHRQRQNISYYFIEKEHLFKVLWLLNMLVWM